MHFHAFITFLLHDCIFHSRHVLCLMAKLSSVITSKHSKLKASSDLNGSYEYFRRQALTGFIIKRCSTLVLASSYYILHLLYLLLRTRSGSRFVGLPIITATITGASGFFHRDLYHKGLAIILLFRQSSTAEC